MYSESSARKAGLLISNAIIYSEEFIDDHVTDETDERARAELGVILAGVALARALKYTSFPRFLRLSLGAFLVSFKLKEFV